MDSKNNSNFNPLGLPLSQDVQDIDDIIKEAENALNKDKPTPEISLVDHDVQDIIEKEKVADLNLHNMHDAFNKEQEAENAELKANLEQRRQNKRKKQPQDAKPEEHKSSHQQRIDNVVNRLYPGDKIKRNQEAEVSVVVPEIPIEDSPEIYAAFKSFLRSESHSQQLDDHGFTKLSDVWKRAQTAEQCKNQGLSPVISGYLKLFITEFQDGNIKLGSEAEDKWALIGSNLGRIGNSENDPDGANQNTIFSTQWIASKCCAKMKVASPLRMFSIEDFANLSEMKFPNWPFGENTNEETEDEEDVSEKTNDQLNQLKEKIYPTFLLDNAEDENIQYSKLMQHIELMHPGYIEEDNLKNKTTQGQTQKKSFDMIDIENLNPFSGKQSQSYEGDLYNIWYCEQSIFINKVNREIGLGASLFLLTLKALTKFFLVLFLINLPVMIMYMDYQKFLGMTKIKFKGKRNIRDGSLGTFAQISMGNLKYMEKNYPTVNDALLQNQPKDPLSKLPGRQLQARTIVSLGCYNDNVFSRAMSIGKTGGGWDKENCADEALKQKSLFFGVQGGGSGCWVAKSNNYVPEEYYDKYGKGSGCGNWKGGWSVNDVYQIKLADGTGSTTTSGQTLEIQEIKALGCYNDQEFGTRAMETRLKGGGWTEARCSAEAAKRKSPMFGLQYWGGECFVAKADNYVLQEDPKRYGKGSGCGLSKGGWGQNDLFEIIYKQPISIVRLTIKDGEAAAHYTDASLGVANVANLLKDQNNFNAASSCYCSANPQAGNQVKLNLNQRSVVSSIKLLNRGSCCPERAYGLEIYAGETKCGVWPSGGTTWVTITCPANTYAQYIKVVQPNNNFLTICGIEVYGQAQTSTSGFEPHATTTSTETGKGENDGARLLITSGSETSQLYGGTVAAKIIPFQYKSWVNMWSTNPNSCTHTKHPHIGQSITLNLPQDAVINQVKLLNRGDCCQEAAYGLKVYAGTKLCGTWPTGQQGWVTFTCDDGSKTTIAKYIKVVQPSEKTLTICAAEVYGSNYTAPSTAITTPKVDASSGYQSIGCYKDNETRAFPTIVNGHTLESCYQLAKQNGANFFAIQYTTWCTYGKDPQYDKYGKATNCVDGKGGAWANSVYSIIDTSGLERKYFVSATDSSSACNQSAQLRLIPNQRNTWSSQSSCNAGTCTHTAYDTTNQWLKFKFAKQESVKQIRLLNRGDCCSDRAYGLEAYVRNDDGLSTSERSKCGVWPDGQNEWVTITCPSELKGTHILLVQPKKTMLTVCGIEVYGSPSTQNTIKIISATYGKTQTANIASKVQTLYQAGTRAFAPSNSVWGDPQKGTVKDLIIKYEYNGQVQTKTVTEGGSQFINLPEASLIANTFTHYCKCSHPGDKGPGKNGMTCDNGETRSCNANQYCFHSNYFIYGQWDSGCKVRDADYCVCSNPGDKTVGKNGGTCTNGQKDFCTSSQYCYNSLPFKLSSLDQGCKERVTQINCQCQKPGDQTSKTNGIACSNGRITYCDPGEYCFSSSTFLSSEKSNFCKKIPITCNCLKAGDLHDNSISCSDGGGTLCPATDYCVNTGTFNYGDWGAACKTKPRPVTCSCQKPGDLGNNNGISCTNGALTYCSSDKYCHSSQEYSVANRDFACKDRPPPTTCQCQNPGSFEADNSLKCTDNTTHQCSSTKYCDSQEKFQLYLKDTVCKDRPYLNQPVKTVRGVKELGCWFDSNDTSKRVFSEHIKDTKADKVMCQAFATTRGQKFFALQSGVCYVGQNPDYKKFGASWKCQDGMGKDFSNFVYEIIPIEQREKNLVQLKLIGGNLTDPTTIFSNTMVKDMISDGKTFVRTCCGKNQGSTCSYTNTAKAGNYIRFDMEKDQLVSKIHLANRDAYPERAYGLKIYANDTLCGTWPKHYDVWYNLSCPAGTVADNIRIVQPNDEILTICGVQVFGPLLVEDASKFYSTSGFVFFIDLVTIISAFIFFELLEVRLQAYIQQFLSDTINVNEFTIGVKNIGDEKLSQIEQINLRAKLHQHFVKLLKNKIPEDVETTENVKHQIAAITFGTDSVESTKNLVQLYKLRMTYLKYNREGPSSCGWAFALYKLGICSCYCCLKDELSAKKAYDDLEQKVKHDIQFQDGESALPKMAFVTFRSIAAAKIILKEYQNEDDYGCFWSGKLSNSRVAVENEDEKFEGNKNLQIIEVTDPDQIIWTNVARPLAQKYGRRAIVWALVAVTIILLIVAQYFISRKIKPQNPVDCATIPNKKKGYAFKQYIEGDEYPLYCFCKSLLFSDAYSLVDKPSWFKMPNGDYENLCFPKIFWQEYGATVLTTLINAFLLEAFFFLVDLEVHEHQDGLSKEKFNKVLLLKFVNTAFIIVFIVNYKDGGFFETFGYMWFQSVGSSLSSTINFMIWQPILSTIGFPLLIITYQWYDRGFFYRVKKTNFDADDDQGVNTSQSLQSEINSLYTGEQIREYQVYEKIFLALLCVMTFSMGMPLLYLTGCAIFLGQYLVQKFLLFKYHSKSTKFGKNFALNSIFWMKISLTFHIIFGFINFVGTYGQILAGHVFYIIFVSPFLVLYIGEAMSGTLKDQILVFLRIKSDTTDADQAKDADLYKEMRISQLYAFYYRTIIEKNELFEHIAQIDPTCYNIEIDNYNQKIKELQKVIKSHYDFLLEQQKKWLGVATKKIQGGTVRDKLEVLLMNDSGVEELARILGKDFLRMQSNIVSYHIHDSAEYVLAGQMKKLLDKEDIQVNKKQNDYSELYSTPTQEQINKSNLDTSTAGVVYTTNGP